MTGKQIQIIKSMTAGWPQHPREAAMHIATGNINKVSRWTMIGNVRKIEQVLKKAGLHTPAIQVQMENLADQAN